MKIVMIGPVYPYKTGLSYYTTLMYWQLQKSHDVVLFSYSLQYPKLLYKKQQKDYEDDVLRVDDIEYCLNTANPISWVKMAKRINCLAPDFVIFQWLHPYFSLCYTAICRLIRNSKILFVCHNVFPHERFVMDKELTKMTLKNGDCFITHSNSDTKVLKSIIPAANVCTAVHPEYTFFKQDKYSKKEARSVLGISDEANVLLFFGLVREYKGLKYLLRALATLNEDGFCKNNIMKLIVAGDFAGTKPDYDEVIKELKIEDLVILFDGHVPVNEVEKFFVATDVVVLPYISATQSGVVQVSYSFNKPVLATKVGGLPDVVINGKTGLLVEPENPDDLSKAIKDFFENNNDFEKGIEQEKYKYSWECMERRILSLFEPSNRSYTDRREVKK